MVGKNAIIRAAKDAISDAKSSRQIEVEYEESYSNGDTTTTALAFLLAAASGKHQLISLPEKTEKQLKKVFQTMDWVYGNRVVVITFTKKFKNDNIDWFSTKLANVIKSVRAIQAHAKPSSRHAPKGQRKCRK